ncbi:MAG: class I SAM-dependent methyltransferase [Phycisphaerales bacterium]
MGKGQATASRNQSGGKSAKKKRSSGSAGENGKVSMAVTADRHVLYEKAVQAVDAEIDFVDDTYKELRGKRATLLREDFAGTGNTSCEWVKRRPSNRAIAVDLDEPTQRWGMEHHVAKLPKSAQPRVTMLNENVLTVKTEPVDCVLAMNFSYFIFKQRSQMIEYFRAVRAALKPDGLFFMDCFGGYESFKVCKETRDIGNGIKYVWDQHDYNPITGEMQCYIGFKFPDGSKNMRAFEYNWRMWTLPEIREILADAGFSRSTVYWEGADEDGEGDGEFEPAESAEQDPAWICYIVGEP